MAGERRERSDVVAHRATRVQRLTAARELVREPAAGPERPEVVAGAVALGSLQPVSAHAAVDEVRVTRRRRVGVEAELVEHVGLQVGHEHVGVGEELLHPGLTFVGAEIEHDRPLAPVVERVRRVRHLAFHADRPEHVAHRVAARRLDLDDVGTPVGEEPGGGGSRDPHAHLHDPEVGRPGQPGQRCGAECGARRLRPCPSIAFSKLNNCVLGPTFYRCGHPGHA